MNPIDKEKFFFLFVGRFGEISNSQKNGLGSILALMIDDSKLSDIRHAAYQLATIKRECADTWLPIEEYGKGRTRSYGNPDPVTGKIYYGRGLVQITWVGNYKKIGASIGVDLYNNPELACRLDIAYQIMSYGMRTGAFTGVGLNRYINDEKCDYFNARKIINGLDHAEEIQNNAVIFESMLKNCLHENVG